MKLRNGTRVNIRASNVRRYDQIDMELGNGATPFFNRNALTTYQKRMTALTLLLTLVACGLSMYPVFTLYFYPAPNFNLP